MIEKVKKGSDYNDTKLQEKLESITDGNFEFLDDFEIEWEIKKN